MGYLNHRKTQRFMKEKVASTVKHLTTLPPAGLKIKYTQWNRIKVGKKKKTQKIKQQQHMARKKRLHNFTKHDVHFVFKF